MNFNVPTSTLGQFNQKDMKEILSALTNTTDPEVIDKIKENVLKQSPNFDFARLMQQNSNSSGNLSILDKTENNDSKSPLRPASNPELSNNKSPNSQNEEIVSTASILKPSANFIKTSKDLISKTII